MFHWFETKLSSNWNGVSCFFLKRSIELGYHVFELSIELGYHVFKLQVSLSHASRWFNIPAMAWKLRCFAIPGPFAIHWRRRGEDTGNSKSEVFCCLRLVTMNIFQKCWFIHTHWIVAQNLLMLNESIYIWCICLRLENRTSKTLFFAANVFLLWHIWSGVGGGWGGMTTFIAFAHMLDATPLWCC